MANVRTAELWASEVLLGRLLQKPCIITKLNTQNKYPIKMSVTVFKGLFQVGMASPADI